MHADSAMRIFRQLEESGGQEENFVRLKDDMILRAIRYARLRTDWALSDLSERKEMDGVRTAAHNALIDSCNILSRTMVRHEKSIQWRKELGEERKEIGEFACYVHVLIGLSAS